jgi:serine/threonine protein kinase
MVPNMSLSGFDLLERMLEYDPSKRITAAEALEHQYFKEWPYPTMKFVHSFLSFQHQPFCILFNRKKRTSSNIYIIYILFRCIDIRLFVKRFHLFENELVAISTTSRH